MGIYDREYYQAEEPRGIRLGGGGRSMIANIVIVNVAIYLLDFIADGFLRRNCGLEFDALQHPTKWWQLLTYGFMHAAEPWHLIGNMIGLWFLGRSVEQHYGSKNFLGIYLTLIIMSGFAWAALKIPFPTNAVTIGASGAVVGVVLLFTFHFPTQTVMIWGVFPLRAWVLGLIIVGSDLFGAMGRAAGGGDNIAYTVHLGGALVGLMIFKTGWHFGKFFNTGSTHKSRRRPRLRLHDPEAKERELIAKADRILSKITIQGEDSLTRKERKILTEYSRRMKQKHK